MFLTMSGTAIATDMEDAPTGDAPESTPEIVETEPSATPEVTPDTQEPAHAPPETTETPQPEAEYALDADIPAGWHNAPVTVTVRIRDKNNAGWQKVEAALRETAERTDLTEQLAHDGLARCTVPDNGIVFFFVTDPYGAEHKKELTASCMDFEAPRLRAGVSSTLLRVEAADTLSGIAGVYVNDELYTTLQNGEFSVRIDKNTRDSHFYIMGVDNAGNRTGYLELGKPFPQEAELKEKSARLAELNTELNIDDRTPMEQAAENVMAKRPSVLGKLKALCVHGAGDRKNLTNRRQDEYERRTEKHPHGQALAGAGQIP